LITKLTPILVFAIYWLGRWHYFHNPFPLPYYVKQSQESGFDVITRRLLKEIFLNDYNRLALSIAILIALAVYLSSQSFFKKTSIKNINSDRHEKVNYITGNHPLALTPDLWASGFAVFLLFHAYQSFYLSRFNLIQNIWDRFHAPLLSLSGALLSIFLLAYSNKLFVRRKQSIVPPFLLCLLTLTIVHSSDDAMRVANGYRDYFLTPYENNIYQLSKDLSTIRDRKKSPLMLVTEAGRLSYYSRIPTIDTWGLNSPEYSINPLQDPSEVSRLKPDIINMHVDFSRLSLTRSSSNDLAVGRSCKLSGQASDNGYCGWHQMNQAIFNGAAELDYEMYLIPFHRARERHDLFMINPSSIFADDIRKIFSSNNAIRLNEFSDLKNYRW